MRRKTTAVRIGNVVLSSEEPVLVQSMLNTSTREVDACVEQAIRIIEAGGRLVRITAPGVKEAEMLGEIHRRLRERGYTTPISADIHFVAEAASVAARYVEKVRINPGNFADKRATFKKLTYRSMQLIWKSCGRNLRSFWRFAGNMERLSASVRIMVRCPIVL